MAEDKGAVISNLVGTMRPEELSALVLDIAEKFPAVAKFLLKTDAIRKGNTERIVSGIRKEMQRGGFYGDWRGYSLNCPDYETIGDDLSQLAENGYCDEVLTLADELFESGNELLQGMPGDHFEDLSLGLSRCMTIAVETLNKSSMEPCDRIEWLLNLAAGDEYGLIGDVWALLDGGGYAEEEALRQSLPERREYHVSVLLKAYRRCGQSDRIIPLLEEEADATWFYAELVDELRGQGESERARAWAIRGAEQTLAAKNGRFVHAQMRKRLCEMALERGDGKLAASYLASEFRERPSEKKYCEIKVAIDDPEAWRVVRDVLLQYLRSGEWAVAVNRENWPLPPEEYVHAKNETGRYSHGTFPNYDALVDIAFREKRIDDIVGLYREYRATHRNGHTNDPYYGGIEVNIADKVLHKHPDVSLEIWQRRVESLINLVKPRAYQSAKPYLLSMRKTYEKLGRVREWEALLQNLKTRHKAKRRLMEILREL